MCGIAGIFHTKNQELIDEKLLTRMVSILQHRGPDESGIYLDQFIGLGHTRLSILDIDEGTQPLCNRDGSLWIVYNGETFNYIELKKELINKGHTFTTDTDTEVVLHLFEEFGPQCLEKINGQFAFAIWNARKKELFLARDRTGVRPLYFTHVNGMFYFASEIKAIFLDPAIKREIDPQALSQVFTFWSTVGDKTIFKGVHALLPGHFITIKKGEITQKPYWNVPYYNENECWSGTLEEAEEELKYLLKDAIRLRLEADVSVGAYLSGGLDSSLITALISKHFNNNLKTFSMGFQEEAFDEASFQKNMIQFLGVEHTQVTISNKDISDNFAQSIWHCETPLLRTAPVPMMLLSKLVSDNQYKVVLSGEGADEIFAGYNIFKETKIRHFMGKMPQSKMRPRLLERLYPYIFKDPSRVRFFLQKFYAVKPEEFSDPFFSHKIRWRNSGKNTSFFSDDILASLTDYHPEDSVKTLLPISFSSRDPLAKAQVLEMNTFLSNYLLSSQGDRVAMANSVEIRQPFLDHRLIDFAFKLPAKWKLKGLNEKYILKRVAAGLIPEGIRNRKKQPYRTPIREALFDDGNCDYINDVLSTDYLKNTGYFNEKKVRWLISKYQNSKTSSEVLDMGLVGILSTQLLHHQFIDNFSFNIEPVRMDKTIRAHNFR